MCVLEKQPLGRVDDAQERKGKREEFVSDKAHSITADLSSGHLFSCNWSYWTEAILIHSHPKLRLKDHRMCGAVLGSR